MYLVFVRKQFSFDEEIVNIVIVLFVLYFFAMTSKGKESKSVRLQGKLSAC